jgi:hypothetical protein
MENCLFLASALVVYVTSCFCQPGGICDVWLYIRLFLNTFCISHFVNFTLKNRTDHEQSNCLLVVWRRTVYVCAVYF